MHRLIFIILTLLSVTALADNSELPESFAEYQIINPRIGQLRFELKILDARSRPTYGEIHIDILDGKTIQTIPVESWLPSPRFDFIDLNDDGYTDLLFYNTQAGFVAGPSTGDDVFI